MGTVSLRDRITGRARFEDEVLWEEALDDEEAERRPLALVQFGVVALVAVALLIRLSAAEHLTPHVDEAASLLAAEMVLERGYPVLPSGTPYLQGATLSYLLAPLVAFGYGGLDHLQALRMISVVAGAAAVFLAYRLAREVTGSASIGLLTAALVTADPVSIQWSGHVRMYALLQAVSLLLLLLFWRVIAEGPTRRRLAPIVVVFWFGVATHIGISLLLPPMFVVALARYGRGLPRGRRDVLGAIAACAAAPVVLSLVNTLLGMPGEAAAQSVPRVSFVGDYLLKLERMLDPSPETWEALFYRGVLGDVAPYLFVALSVLVVARYVLFRPAEEGEGEPSRLAIGFIAAFYWVPVTTIALILDDAQDRYLLLIQALGFLTVAIALRAMLSWRPALGVDAVRQRRVMRIVGGGVALLLALHTGAGLAYLAENQQVDPDYVDASRYVAARHTPGELVITALPPPTYLALDGREDVMFLPGPYDRQRAERYTRILEDGSRVDYWLGAPSIVTAHQLCTALLENPGVWLVLDGERILWALEGDMAMVVQGLTHVQYLEPGGAAVFRLRPLPSRSGEAERVCARAALMPPPPTTTE